MLRNVENKILLTYNYFLKEIEKNIGKNTTFDVELDKAGKKLFGSKFKGVYPFDKIPKYMVNGTYLIFNLDESNEPGSHWCAIAKIKDKIYVYDSFGRHVLSGSDIIHTDSDAEQHVKETNCGQRCLAWLLVVDSLGIKFALMI